MKYYLSTIADIEMTETRMQGVTENKDRQSISPGFRYDYLDRTAVTAARYGLGLELAEYCISENLDDDTGRIDGIIKRKTGLVPEVVMHAPYNELYPSAVDSVFVKLTRRRLDQAAEKAARCGASKLIVHTGYVPVTYYREWFLDRSVEFWKEFARSHREKGLQVCIENVMETDPCMLTELIERIDDPMVRMTLDIGHANVTEGPSPEEWVRICAPFISHFHIHNNMGIRHTGIGAANDLHLGLGNGSMDMKELLNLCESLCPEATAAVESFEFEASVQWLKENGFI